MARSVSPERDAYAVLFVGIALRAIQLRLAGCCCRTKESSELSAAVCRLDQMLRILESA